MNSIIVTCYQRVPLFLLYLLSTVLLIAVIYIGLHNFPSGPDDFIRAVKLGSSYGIKHVDDGYFDGIKNWYLYHNGRFTNSLITDPYWLYDHRIYKYLAPLLFITWVASVFLFIRQLLLLFDVKTSTHIHLMVTCLILMTSIANMPVLKNWLFWYASATVYLFGASLLLFTLTVLMKSLKENKFRDYLFAAFLAFLTAGNVEITTLVLLGVLASFSLLALFSKKPSYSHLPFLASLLGFFLLISSPATVSRFNGYSDKRSNLLLDLFNQAHSIVINFIPTIHDALVIWLKNGQSILLFFICVFLGCISAIKISYRKAFAVTFSCFSCLLAMIIVPAILNDAVPILKSGNRISNLTYFLFLMVAAIQGLVMGGLLQRAFSKFKLPCQLVFSSLLVLLIFFAISQSNIINMFDDIHNNRPAQLVKDKKQWQILINNASAHKDELFVLPRISEVKSLSVSMLGPNDNPARRENILFAQLNGIHKPLKVANFDHALRQFMAKNYQPIVETFNAHYFEEAQRRYLLLQIVEDRSHPPIKFCVTLTDKSINDTRFDENLHIPFEWINGEYCASLYQQALYCDSLNEDWFCRIALPLSAKGPLIVSTDTQVQTINLKP